MAEQLMETNIPRNYQQNMRAIGNNWDPADTYGIFDTLIASMSDFLGQVKSKESKVALVHTDLKGNFKFAGVVQYHPNEENPDMPGNWSYIMTFDEEDIKEAKVYDANDLAYQRSVAAALFDLHKWSFNEFTFISQMVSCAVSTLIEWLDKNADPDKVVEVELPGYFKASVAIESGEKIMAIVPDGSMKTYIKSDIDIQVD